MARLTWTSGDKGTRWREVDASAHSRSSTLRDILELIGLVSDTATGDNSPPVAATGAGGGAGCQLGIPLMSDFRPETRVTFNATGQVNLRPLLFTMPPGETSIVAELPFAPPGTSAVLRNASTWAVVDQQSTYERFGGYGRPSRVAWNDLTPGTTYVHEWVHTADNGDVITAAGASLFFPRLGESQYGPPVSGDGTMVAKLNTQAITAGTAPDLIDRDSTETLARHPYGAIVVQEAARNLHTLDEMILGRAAMGVNDIRTLDDGSSARAFLYGDRSQYTSEPGYHVPLFTWSGGITPLNGGTGVGGDDGVVTDTAYTPGATFTTGAKNAIVARVAWPRFANSSAARLRCRQLWQSPDGTGFSSATVNARVQLLSAGNSVVSTAVGSGNIAASNPSGEWYTGEVTETTLPAGGFVGAVAVGLNVASGSLKGNGQDARLAACEVFLEVV